MGVARSAATAELIRAPSAADLLVGQVLRARVVRIEEELAYLRWGEHTVAAAAGGQLALGQMVSLQVEATAAGKLVLRLLDEATRGAPLPAVAAERGHAEQPAPPDAPPLRSASGADATARPTLSTGAGSSEGPVGSPPTLVLPDDQTRAAARGEAGRTTASRPTAAPVSHPDPGVGATDAGPPLPRATPHPPPAAGAPPATSLVPADPATSASGEPPAAAPGPPARPELGLDDGALADAQMASPRLPGLPAVLLARAALPAYGRVVHGWSGATPEAALPEGAGSRSAPPVAAGNSQRASAPEPGAALRALLAELGLSWDGPVTGHLAELSGRSAAPLPSADSALAQRLLALGGAPAEARPLVLLASLGLPHTPRSAELARQLLSGELDAWSAWRAALEMLPRLAQSAATLPTPLRAALGEALALWAPPASAEPTELARWLRHLARAVGTPPEAKLARLSRPERLQAELLQDARTQLAQLQHAVGTALPADEAARGTLERLRSAVEAEQLLNSAQPREGAPRDVVLTLPAASGGQPGGVLELRVQQRARGADQEGASPPDIVSLRLDLPHLGAVRVRLAVRRPRFACRFLTDRAATAALLQARAGELIERLGALGYSAPSVDAACQPACPRGSAAAELSVPRHVQRLDIRT